MKMNFRGGRFMKKGVGLSVFLFFSFLSGALLGNIREVTAKYVVNGPKIDGRLDDPIWKNGVWFTDFSLISDSMELAEAQSTQLAEGQTEFQLAYDDAYLYIAIRVSEPELGCLKIKEFRRDGAISQDDSIEVMIDPYGDRYDYFHFMVNAAGVKYDARHSHEGLFHDVGWNSNWQVATKIGFNEWTLEMAIPFSELHLNRKSEGPWTFNIARHRWAGNKIELSSFSLMKDTFHDAERFSKLRMSEFKASKFLWGVKRPFDYHIEADKGNWVLTGKVEVRNEGSPNEKFKLLFKQVTRKGAIILDVITDEMAVGVEKEYVFHLPVERQEPLELAIEVVNAEDIQEVYRVKGVVLDVDYEAMTLQMIVPSYRNTIYPSEEIYELQMMVHLALSSKVLNRSRLQIRLMNEKTMNMVLETEVIGLSHMQKVYLPVGNLAPGRYVIEAQLFEDKGEIIAKMRQILTKLKYEESEWRIDSDGGLLHNGKAFLPEGWFGMLPGEVQMANELPYNTLFMPKDYMVEEQEAKRYLDSVAKVKGYAIMYPYPFLETVDEKQNLARVLTSGEVKALQQRVSNLKKHPALMAWVIAYKPEFNKVSLDRIKQVYEAIIEEDPWHPTIVVNGSIPGIRGYAGIADIAMINTPITFKKEEGSMRPLDSVSYYMDIAKKIVGKDNAFWAALQAYDHGSNLKELVRAPKFIELRNMLYQAVLQGTKGFFWDNYAYTYNYPEIKMGVEYLAKELNVLKNAILEKEASKEVIVDCENKKGVYYSTRVVGSTVYFFGVNTGSTGQQIKFEVPKLMGIDKLYVLSENRTLEVKKGILSDYYEPYAVHIYTSKNLNVNLESLDEIQEKIDVISKGKKKVGNLAFEDSGVKISASSTAGKSSTIRLNDGVFGGIAWKSKKEEGLPQWVELNWPNPIRVEKIVIYSDKIESAKVQVKENGVWVDVADFKRRSEAHLRAIFKGIDVSQLRILITDKKLGAEEVTISEIEVYNNSTQEVEL